MLEFVIFLSFHNIQKQNMAKVGTRSRASCYFSNFPWTASIKLALPFLNSVDSLYLRGSVFKGGTIIKNFHGGSY